MVRRAPDQHNSQLLGARGTQLHLPAFPADSVHALRGARQCKPVAYTAPSGDPEPMETTCSRRTARPLSVQGSRARAMRAPVGRPSRAPGPAPGWPPRCRPPGAQEAPPCASASTAACIIASTAEAPSDLPRTPPPAAVMHPHSHMVQYVDTTCTATCVPVSTLYPHGRGGADYTMCWTECPRSFLQQAGVTAGGAPRVGRERTGSAPATCRRGRAARRAPALRRPRRPPSAARPPAARAPGAAPWPAGPAPTAASPAPPATAARPLACARGCAGRRVSWGYSRGAVPRAAARRVGRGAQRGNVPTPGYQGLSQVAQCGQLCKHAGCQALAPQSSAFSARRAFDRDWAGDAFSSLTAPPFAGSKPFESACAGTYADMHQAARRGMLLVNTK